jgi:hypothetical protein
VFVQELSMLYRYFSSSEQFPAVETLRAIVDENHLWAAAPFTFNDPFEFTVKLDLSAPTEVRLARYRRDNPLASKADARLWERTVDGAAWHTQMNLRASLIGAHGVICYTRNWDSLLLWSHYAKAHTGFCVGFDENELVAWDEVSSSGTVCYVDESPVFRAFYDPPAEFAHKAMFHKARDWEVEGEFRLVFESHGKKIFPRTALREVILGCRAEQALRQYTSTLSTTGGIDVFQMAEELTEFRLKRHRVQANVSMMTSFF